MMGTLNVLSTEYEVELKDNVADVDRSKRQALFGQVDPFELRIRLYKRRVLDEIKKTLIHELIHLAEDHIRKESFSPTEDDVQQLTEILYDTLKRNGLFVDDWSHIIGEVDDDEK